MACLSVVSVFFFIGFREDLGVNWNFPIPVFSQEALLWDLLYGTYWDRHKIAKKDWLRPKQKISRDERPVTLPWRTVRDAISDIPDPELHPRKAAESMHSNHRFQPGARVYPGHTGSPYDEPAKTLKAGVHGVPGGENMLLRPDGSVRYFTVRECARLQTFSDDFLFHGSWTETMRQLGNAVPVELARVVGSDIMLYLNGNKIIREAA